MGKSGPWSRENTKLVYKHMEIHGGTPKTARELSGLAPQKCTRNANTVFLSRITTCDVSQSYSGTSKKI